ncbi:threonine--tRNA ligase [Spiroplasma turonicum]|uniref:Threonine--tRNA ligase n=1 Tax=Spiroplasma turonicum TaxID=216946 RepID=A0A0K1P790_9MOLU|nr:threonine--tRNA ligase [Spiroplasma turonicum]AKU80155.1 threonyl-tRNA synthetase [Spiroplasma turonicum]ALX71155.1 threonyl-tRNA synthetase [Spiroplasma turonicum]
MKINIDSKIIEVNEPTTILDIFNKNNIDSNKFIAKLGDELLPFEAKLKKDCSLSLIEIDENIIKSSNNYLAKLILEASVLKCFAGTEVSIPKKDINKEEASVVFYSKERIKKEELTTTKDQFKQLIKEGINFELNYNQNLNNYYKNELLNSRLDFNLVDYPFVFINDSNLIVRYPIFKESFNIREIEIINFSGEYYNNDASETMLQKISFVVANDKKQLSKIIKSIEDKRLRDHRYINENLEIFNIDPVIGLGLPFWLPNGAILKQEIKKYLKEKEFEYRFIQIESPVLGSKLLYEKSGHWNHYRENMFTPIELPDNETLVLRPMNCPHHVSVYKSKIRSYRDLPLRFAEHAIQHRYEFSGSLTGLERVRAMELTDSHIFVTPSQLKDEFINCYKLIVEVLQQFNIKIKYLSLSMRDPNDKENYYNNDEMWNNAEKQLEGMLNELNLKYEKMVGEAAFYGPKLDIQVETALGHEITVSTIQLDFLLPERFDLEFINSEGNPEKPIMIHRGLIGTYERFVAILLEQTMGVLPLWCSPVQVSIIPVSEKYNDFARQVESKLHDKKIRCFISDRDDRLNNKIRNAITKKTPYIIVLGQKELENNLVTYRTYGNEEQIQISIDEFVSKISKEYENRE